MGKGANAPCPRELKVRVGFASLRLPYSLRAAWNIAGRLGRRFQLISRKLRRAEQLVPDFAAAQSGLLAVARGLDVPPADELTLSDDAPKENPWLEDLLGFRPFAERLSRVILNARAPNGLGRVDGFNPESCCRDT